MRPPHPTRTIRLLFFLSGAIALAYEVLWTKWLTRVIGITTFSVSTVVASFLTGLALGGVYFGRRIDRRGNALKLYAGLEAGIALCALAVYLLLPLITGAYVWLHRGFEQEPGLVLLARVVLSFLVLLLPTFLMGGTLPVLCRREVSKGEGVASSLSALYAINTLGGVTGTLLAGFILIGSLGLRGTLLVAVATNLAAAGVALMLNAREEGVSPTLSGSPAGPLRAEQDPIRGTDTQVAATGAREKSLDRIPDGADPGRPAPIAREAGKSGKGSRPSDGRGKGKRGAKEIDVLADALLDRRGRTIILVASALSGFVALSFEVLWTRALGIFLRSGIVYSFSLALANFLLGIVVGSWLYHKLLVPRRAGTGIFALLQAGVGVAGLISLLVLSRVGDLPDWVAARMGGGYAWGQWAVVWILASMGVMLVPSILMGILFPLAGSLVVSREKVGGGIGILYAANGLGSVLGALTSGFLLIPRLGTLESLRVNSLLSLALAVAAVFALPGEKGRRKLGASLAIALGGAGAIAFASALIPSDLLRQRIIASRPGTNLYYAEGAAGLIEVYDRVGVEGDHYKKLYDNGTSYAGSTQSGRRYHKLLGHLPALLHPDPRRGLVIGFGSGMTFGAMLLDPRIQKVDCVELSPEVLAAAPFFAQDNGGAMMNPKGSIVLGDGREHLLATDEQYDLISLEPPPPRFAGVVNLYSVDFYRLCRRRMRPGGIMAQWIPMHSHTIEEMRDLIRSFVEVFPESTFWVPTQRDGILVGSASPLKVSAEELRRRIGIEPVASDLRSIDIGDLGALLGPLLLDPPAVRSYAREAHLITDDRPSIEYFAGHGLFERPGHLEDVFRFGINPGKWLEQAGGGQAVIFTPQEIRHLEAVQQILLGGVAGDRGDLEGKKRAYAAALLLDPGSVFIRRLNLITGTPEE